MYQFSVVIVVICFTLKYFTLQIPDGLQKDKWGQWPHIIAEYICDGEIYSGVELNFPMGFNITTPYMEFLHLNWYIAEWYSKHVRPITHEK